MRARFYFSRITLKAIKKDFIWNISYLFSQISYIIPTFNYRGYGRIYLTEEHGIYVTFYQ